MAYETIVALRQLRAGRTGSLSALTSIAVAGVILAVAALVTVMSVTGGFQRLFREKVLGLNAHVLIMRYGIDFTEYREVMDRARKVPGVRGASPFLFHEMMVSAGDVLAGVMVKGVDPATLDQVSDLRQYLAAQGPGLAGLTREGQEGRPPGIILGRELATKLGVQVGDPVMIVSPLKGLDPASFNTRDMAPTSAPFTVVGIYHSGFYEYDSRLLFVHYQALQSFFRQPDAVTGVELAVADIFATQEVARQVRVKLGDQRYLVQSWAVSQVEQLTRLAATRDRLRHGLLLVLVLLFVTAATLLLAPSRRRRVARGVLAAATVTVAALLFAAAWVSEWGAVWLPEPELGLTPHLRVARDDGAFLEYRNALVEARSLPEVVRSGPYIVGASQVLLDPPAAAVATPPEDRRVRIRGYDSESATLPLERFVVAGGIGYLVPPLLPESRMPPYRAVLGEGLARSLGVQVGSTFRIQPEVRGARAPEVGPYRVEVVALVRTGDPEADGGTIFLDFLAARRILTLVDEADGIEAWVDDPLAASEVAARLSSRLGGHSYRTLDWKEINHNIFRSLELQKQSLSLVLFVITVVAALNIISTLVLMVIDKGHQIAILKTMGSSGMGILRIFVVQGFLIGLVGTIAGLGLGYGVCQLIARIRFPLQADVYLIDYLPVDLAVSDFVIAGVAALIVSLWATLYPAIRAAALTPVEGLRQVGG